MKKKKRIEPKRHTCKKCGKKRTESEMKPRRDRSGILAKVYGRGYEWECKKCPTPKF